MPLDWSSLLNTKRALESRKLAMDYRSELERDYDRALFSTPVRRLQDKAQVFPLESNDSIRTRLTHSLEVSSIARVLGYYCAPRIIELEKLPQSKRRDIEILCQTCGLLHDVGNPPFGHAGEVAIANWFKKLVETEPIIKLQICGNGLDSLGQQRLNDFAFFDGNAQAFRILTRLQLVDNYYGLNLTYATLATMLKYTAPSHKINKEVARLKKHGYFFSENQIVEEIVRETGIGNVRHPLTYLVEAADDIAYAVVDIEDALRKGVIQWHLLESEELKALHEYRVLAETTVAASEAGPHLHPAEKEHAYATRLRTILITELVASIIRAFEKSYPQIMDGSMAEALEKCCDRSEVFAACKLITRKYVYFARETLKLEIMGRNIVSDLLNLFWEGIVNYDSDAKSFHFPNKIWEIMSLNYRYVFEHNVLSPFKGGKEIDYYSALQLAVDNVCGMTDTFACRLHKELFNVA